MLKNPWNMTAKEFAETFADMMAKNKYGQEGRICGYSDHEVVLGLDRQEPLNGHWKPVGKNPRHGCTGSPKSITLIQNSSLVGTQVKVTIGGETVDRVVVCGSWDDMFLLPIRIVDRNGVLGEIVRVRVFPNHLEPLSKIPVHDPAIRDLATVDPQSLDPEWEFYL